MKRIVLLLLVTLSVCSFGQNVDSLYIVYMNAKGSEYARLANAISEAAGDTTTFTDEAPRDKILAHVMKTIINYYYDLQRFKEVEIYVDLAIPLYEEMGDSVNLAGCYHTAGVAYHHMGLFDRAIESYYKSSDILQSIGGDNSKRRSRYVLNNIGSIYFHIENYDMAEKLFNQCIEMINDQESDKRNGLDLSNYLNNLSEIYLIQSENLEGNARQTKINDAIASAENALELAYQYEDAPAKITKRLITLASASIANKEYVKAEKLITEAQSIAEKNNQEQLLAEIFFVFAKLRNNTGNLHQANLFFDKAIEIAEQNEYNDLLKHITQTAYLTNKALDPKKALVYFEKQVAIKETLLNEESQKQLNEFEVKFKIAEKELEIERQQAEISRHRTLQYLYIGGLSVAGLILVMLIYIVMLRTRRNRELAEMNATKDKFFSIISHDLKNPALAQRDAIQLLLDNSGQWDAASLSNYYQKLLKSANGQVDLLFTLLGWAQLQTGRMPFQPAQFDLVDIVHSSIGLIRNMAEDKDLIFDVRLPEAALTTCDINMLTTVLRNLLTNAVKFTPKGGRVSLDISSGLHTPVKYLISVSDTGIGMNPEQMQNLFRLDRQHSRRGTSGEQGSGLGLIVCRELLQKHGSELHIESEEKQGSRFWFEI